MVSLTLTNVRPWGGDAVDLVLDGDRIASVVPAGSATPGGDALDGGGRLALPGFVNAHAHVDKSWWGQPWVSYGGEATTQGRIAHERAEREKYGIPSAASTTAVLREYLRHGTTAVRSHVDVDLGVGLRGIEAVRDAVDALGGAVEVEIVAFPQDGVMRRPGVLQLLDDAAAAGATSIGGIDPSAIDRDPVAQLDGLFEIAQRRGVGLDIHLHSGGELGAFEYELIIDRTLAAGLQGRVNVSHGFALGELAGARQAELLARLAEAGIGWSTVAPVRTAPLPWREMRDLGIPIGLGTDGIRDLWSPYGDGDILRIALGFARLHGLRYDEDLTYAVELATTRAASYVHRSVHDLVPGARADVVLLDAENVPDALMRAPRREVVVAGGRVVVDGGELLV
ncbi:N-isopropylammelide isopropylaminohydrolase [Beutenbergia cavernae DSM 12333]|uniref:N-isopropylammelide isopropylaminohydrolase n=1 Tax=Beutenbergia cavernae (strain ATCC BAA-8 / DSM 12333 / CCUG 43141 / JCM 11478 / NBRC 16432 / NCIMB 13614 / HKI 0122) TaxID=471853 RepID=C5C2M3_BEUC1|nr:amidohydrolase [Beutenbergia cavernae]ACQ79709.1 N-isopropylammelide isopropylaminohydrolase [Beutenbergia cavernae DSM 12333]